MGTDLFRIVLSRDIDRSRYLRAMLSTGHPSAKRNLPRCLRPDKPQTRTHSKSWAQISSHPHSSD